MGPDTVDEFDAQEGGMDEAFLASQPVDDYRPKVSNAVRDRVYYIGLAVSVLSFLAAGIAAIWLEDPLRGQVMQTAALLGTGFGIIASGLGVAYRPGKTLA